jgi:uncharacterized protein (UPF0297 family)
MNNNTVSKITGVTTVPFDLKSKSGKNVTMLSKRVYYTRKLQHINYNAALFKHLISGKSSYTPNPVDKENFNIGLAETVLAKEILLKTNIKKNYGKVDLNDGEIIKIMNTFFFAEIDVPMII